MSYPQVTVIVVPHQLFSYTQESLESIYQHTNIPFKLIYVDGYSPTRIKQYLEIESKEKGFRLISTEKYVSPNQARNIALNYVDTEYVVFINNDVLVTPNWLNDLMQCDRETNASVVSPVCLQESEQHIHYAGGSLEFEYKDGNLDLFEKRLFLENDYDRVKSLLTRQPTQIINFNCVLARTSILQQIGNLDENLAFVEEIDFSLSVFAVGGSIYLEPKSIVNYIQVKELSLSDIPYYYLRWNYIWKRKSIKHFQEKWGLAKDAKFINNILESAPIDLTFKPLKELIKP